MMFYLYVITRYPSDYPDHYVVRRHTRSGPEHEPFAITDSLAEARQKIPRGLTRFPRWREDDPVIVETWL